MDIIFLIFFFIVITFSAIIHEYSHGWMADRLGDPTARLAGRLTLNPIPHIDPIGTILMPLLLLLFSGGSFLFAFAKPVPVNPYNLKNSRYSTGLVSFAGPASNIITAIVFSLIVRLLPFSAFTAYVGIIVYANILLAVFNLIPIPPLDGSKILFTFLPDQFNNVKVFLETYGIFFLFIFIFYIFGYVAPLIDVLFKLLTGHQF